jgi:hypothetical protein
MTHPPSIPVPASEWPPEPGTIPAPREHSTYRVEVAYGLFLTGLLSLEVLTALYREERP